MIKGCQLGKKRGAMVNLLEKIKKAGVVGAGGAGFPTHVKLNCKVEYFIVNAIECEPLLKSDKYIMRKKSDEIIKAVEEIGSSIEADKLIIGLKEEYAEEIEALENSIKKLNSKVRLHLCKAFYPAGDEQVLVYEVTGRVIPPGGIPLNVGAVVSNVGTVFNIFEAIEDKPVTYKFVTVIGEVSTPSIIKVPIGTTIKDCIEKCNGALMNDFSVIVGGPMMGKRIAKDEIENRVITKTDSALIILSEEHYLIEREKLTIKQIKNQAKSACIQCRFCTDMCPRNLIGHPINPHKIMRAVAFNNLDDEILKEALICCECGACELYACPMGLSPKRINVSIKDQLREKGVKWEGEKEDLKASSMRDYRKVPTSRLISRLQLDKYKNQYLEEGKVIQPSEVKIPLGQGIGAPTEPMVEIGDTVVQGQPIGSIGEGKMGSNIHASIDGTVIEISDTIVIKAI